MRAPLLKNIYISTMRIEKSLFYQRILFIAFWIRAVWGFFASDFFMVMKTVEPAVYLAFDAVIVALGLATMSRKRDIIYAAVFIGITYFTTCVSNKLSLMFYLNGLRDFIAYLFLIPIANYFLDEPNRRERFIECFDRQMFIFLVIQVPCVLFQFFMYGAGDMGGGSLGHWNSGFITTMIFAISFYLMKKRIDPERYVTSLWENKVLILLLLPTQFNETKISFIYFIMYFVLLLPMNRKLFMRLVLAIPAIGFLLWGVSVGYVISTGGTMGDTMSMDYYTEMYLMDSSGASEAYAQSLIEEDTGEQEDVPRFTKIILLGDVNQEHPGHIMTGFGVGQFKGGTVAESSKFFKEYEWLLIGTIPYIFHVLIQIGIIGVVLMIAYFYNLFGAPHSGMKRDYNVQFFFFLLFVMLMFYNDTIRSAFMMLPITIIILESWKEKSDDDIIPETTATL